MYDLKKITSAICEEWISENPTELRKPKFTVQPLITMCTCILKKKVIKD